MYHGPGVLRDLNCRPSTPQLTAATDGSAAPSIFDPTLEYSSEQQQQMVLFWRPHSCVSQQYCLLYSLLQYSTNMSHVSITNPNS